MQRTLKNILAGSLIAGSAIAAGCEYSQKANTNTLAIKDGVTNYKFQTIEVDQLVMEDRHFALIPRLMNRDILYNGIPLNEANILDSGAVPTDNSRVKRTKDSHTLTHNGETYVFINAYWENGTLKINDGSGPQESFFVTGRKPTPQNTKRNDLETTAQTQFERFTSKAPHVMIQGEKYLIFPAENSYGPDAILIREASAEIISTEDHRPGRESIYKTGFNAEGFVPVHSDLTSWLPKAALSDEDALKAMGVIEIDEAQ